MEKRIRKRSKVKIKQRKSTLFVLFIILLILAMFSFINSSFFNIKAVQVEGNYYLNDATIEKTAAIPESINIFKINIHDIKEKLGKDPLVKDVDVEREFPSTIKIHLIERVPVGVVVLNGCYVEIDKEGTVLALNGTHFDLPFITGVKGKTGSVGKQIQVEELDLILKILKKIESHIQSQIAEINLSQKDEINFFTNDAITVYMGSQNDLDHKIKLLSSILNDIHSKNQDVKMIDIRNGKQAVVK